MSTPLSRVITNHIFNVPAGRQRKPAVKPSDIPTLKGYTAVSAKCAVNTSCLNSTISGSAGAARNTEQSSQWKNAKRRR